MEPIQIFRWNTKMNPVKNSKRLKYSKSLSSLILMINMDRLFKLLWLTKRESTNTMYIEDIQYENHINK